MRTIDWYIVRSFLISVLLALVSLLALRILLDLFANIDEFAERGQFVDVVKGIATYYGVHTLEYISQLGGVIVVFSAVFTLARMNHTNELTAMLASGMSLHRVVWPIIIVAMMMGGLVVANQELLVPNFADELMVDADGQEDARAGAFGVGLVKDGRRVWYAPRYVVQSHQMIRPMCLFRDDRQVVVALGQSKNWAVPVEAGPDSPGGWAMGEASLLRRDSARDYEPRTEAIYTNVGRDAFLASIKAELQAAGLEWVTPFRDAVGFSPVWDESQQLEIAADSAEMLSPAEGEPARFQLNYPRFSFHMDISGERVHLGSFEATSAVWIDDGPPKDWHWRLSEHAVLFCPSSLTPKDLEVQQVGHKTEYMSSHQLGRVLKTGRARNQAEVRLIRHVRIAEPINNLVMLLLGLPFILSRERNVKASFGLCVLMVGAFFAFVFVCRYMALPPFWGAFLPTLLFGPVAIVMLDAVKT